MNFNLYFKVLNSLKTLSWISGVDVLESDAREMENTEKKSRFRCKIFKTQTLKGAYKESFENNGGVREK